MSNDENYRPEHPATEGRFAVAIIAEPSDPIARSCPCQWAIGELADTLRGRGIAVHRYRSLAAIRREFTRILIQPPAEDMKRSAAGAESFSITPIRANGATSIVIEAADTRGLVYAITELADRAAN